MIERLTTYCAACGKLLGTVTDDGWFWHTGSPARLANCRRFICEWPGAPEEAPAAPAYNFRMRTVERMKFQTPETRPGEQAVVREADENVQNLWEYPYTCDDDACMNALGVEWKWTVSQSGAQPKFSLLPAGRVLS